MTSKEALEKLSYIPIYEEDEHNIITDINNCCTYKGDLCEIYGNEIDTIKKDLEVLEILKNNEISISYIDQSTSYDDYIDKCDYFRCLNYITEEEYAKLKECLENDNR